MPDTRAASRRPSAGSRGSRAGSAGPVRSGMVLPARNYNDAAACKLAADSMRAEAALLEIRARRLDLEENVSDWGGERDPSEAVYVNDSEDEEEEEEEVTL